MTFTATKDPDAVLDYSIEWAKWLGRDRISSSAWDVPTGLTKVSESNTKLVASVWISGGTVGTTYTVRNRIVTVGGRTEDRSIAVTVGER